MHLNTVSQNHPFGVALVLVLSLTFHPAHSSDDVAFTSPLKLSGFATTGGVWVDDAKTQFGQPLTQKDGASRKVDYGVDSRLGLQASYQFTPNTSATLQVLSVRDMNNSYSPKLEWAYINTQVSQNTQLKLGRILTPLFLHSDSRNVGYATHWVRPPVEVYAQAPLRNIDGASLSSRWNMGQGGIGLQAVYGNAPKNTLNGVQGGVTYEGGAQQVWGGTAQYDNQGFTLRASYFEADSTFIQPYMDQLLQALRSAGTFSATSQSWAEKLEGQHKKAKFVGIAAHYDRQDWFVMSEYVKRNVDSYVGSADAWYAFGGIRHQVWTAYAGYSKLNYPGISIDSQLSQQGLSGLEAAIRRSQTPYFQHTTTLGVRWDGIKNTAFKLQLDAIRAEAPNFGYLLNSRPDFDGSANVLSATVDIIF
jgi:hypothetical protein